MTVLQVIDPSQFQPDQQVQATARSDSSHLAQDYREQPDEDQAGSSHDGTDDLASELDPEELVSDDEDGGPSTWLEDPPKGETAIQCWCHCCKLSFCVSDLDCLFCVRILFSMIAHMTYRLEGSKSFEVCSASTCMTADFLQFADLRNNTAEFCTCKGIWSCLLPICLLTS